MLKRLTQAEGGYAAMALALIGVMLTAALVIPYLGFVQTSLLAARSAGKSLSGLSCGAAGAEHALWRLQYDQPFIDALTPQSPSATYEITCEGDQVPIAVSLQPQPSTLPSYLTEYAYADIVLTVDVSGSISSSEMAILKEVANAIVDGFNLFEHSERYRIGVARFRGSSASVAGMTNVDAALTDPPEDHHGGVPLHDGINGLNGSGLGSGTNLVAGIQRGSAQFGTGLGDRTDIPNLMVFLTDGDDSHGNGIPAIENASANSGARIFVVGVDAVFPDTLNAIASEPDADHVFYSADFQGLLDLIDDIVAAVTQGGLAGSLYDIQVTAPDGTILQIRALRTIDGEIVLISIQEI